ncbi:erythromycin esterase family protein [Amycolatopsis keratiniphila]|uniref:erythromycin esterase family protein n=1 Tax=Amycolatopsis keratiniphila TaxID=129921 RepID=UPI00087BE9CF|nr:erythromycin esterase family protein [Amycolatopsis keratiniphila]OLZ58965.1 erythromycin esterase [Amycolatopsis keratiniphila subsp. nogabecina]SDU69879.1 erythromycin esterase [Amycolatopsis keratiniphila]
MSDPAKIAELIGDARIVAIGENNHHIHEFGDLRNRLLRHLVERHGFRVVAFESGFAEGKLVEDWLKGAPGDVADIGRGGFTFSLGESPEAHEMLTWLRERGDVAYYGLDVPSSAGSPVPSLDAVRAYLSTVDENATGLVDAAIEATKVYASVSSADAPAKYAALDDATKDKATAVLTRLKTHLTSLRPVYGDTTVAEHHVEGALRVDAYLAEVAAMMSGDAPARQSGSRDAYMADTVRLIRRLHGDDTKIVVMLHNGHLQRVPFSPFPGLTSPSAGTHLAAEFGEDYFALGLTAAEGETTGLKPDASARLGFTVYRQDLEAPVDGSVETEGPGLVDLRARRGTEGSQSIRHAHLFNPVDVVEAFDALVCFPKSTVSAHIGQDQSNG